MTPFAGIDPLPTPVYVLGKGLWTNGDAADDGDDRDAASAMLLAQCAINRTVWLRWRMMDGLNGGTYSANYTWLGNHVFSGNATFDHIHVLHVSQLDGNVECGAGLDVAGNFSVDGTGTFNDPVQFGDTVIRVGNDAYESQRRGTGPNSDWTFDPWKKDLWIAPVITTTSRIWTLNAPPNDETVETTIMQPDQTATQDLVLYSEGFAIAVLGTGQLKSVVVIWDGSRYQVKASHL